MPNSSLNCLRSSPVPAKQQAWNFKARYCGKQICQMATAHLHFHLWCGCVWLTPASSAWSGSHSKSSHERYERPKPQKGSFAGFVAAVKEKQHIEKNNLNNAFLSIWVCVVPAGATLVGGSLKLIRTLVIFLFLAVLACLLHVLVFFRSAVHFPIRPSIYLILPLVYLCACLSHSSIQPSNHSSIYLHTYLSNCLLLPALSLSLPLSLPLSIYPTIYLSKALPA